MRKVETAFGGDPAESPAVIGAIPSELLWLDARPPRDGLKGLENPERNVILRSISFELDHSWRVHATLALTDGIFWLIPGRATFQPIWDGTSPARTPGRQYLVPIGNRHKP